MPKQKSHEVAPQKSDQIVIEINPFDIEGKIRKPLPPPSRFHKNKSKYSRKQKHGKGFSVDE
jgi:hypothetical protein